MAVISDVTVRPLELAMRESFTISLEAQSSADNFAVVVHTDTGTTGLGEERRSPDHRRQSERVDGSRP